MARILIVDDDVNLCEVTADIFKAMGHTCQFFHNGLAGLEGFQKGSYDIVLSDVKMPKMNGVEMIREIRKIQPDLPVIMMTAFRREDPMQQALDEIKKRGPCRLVHKPFEPQEILQLIEEITDKKRSQ